MAYFGNLEQVDQSRTSRPISEKESWIEIRCTCTLQRKNITINNFSLPNLATFLINWFPCLFVHLETFYFCIFIIFILRYQNHWAIFNQTWHQIFLDKGIQLTVKDHAFLQGEIIKIRLFPKLLSLLKPKFAYNLFGWRKLMYILKVLWMKVLTCKKSSISTKLGSSPFWPKGNFVCRHEIPCSSQIGGWGRVGRKVHVIAKFNELTKFDESYQNQLLLARWIYNFFLSFFLNYRLSSSWDYPFTCTTHRWNFNMLCKRSSLTKKQIES